MKSSVFLDTNIKALKGIGETREALMRKLGIRTVRDLVGYFPRAYEDRTRIVKIDRLAVGDTAGVIAMAAAPPEHTRLRKGLDMVKFKAVDETGTMSVVYFNQSYAKDMIKQGKSYVFYGKAAGTARMPEMINPIFEPEEKAGATTGRIVPVYGLTAGLTQKAISSAVRAALSDCGDNLPDSLPREIAERHGLCGARYAYENIHFPQDEKALETARERLIFEELFVLCAAMKMLRMKRAGKPSTPVPMPDLEEFYGALPYAPTGAQRRVIGEAARDMGMPTRMNRLIRGDVGSGKTLVAAACCWIAWRGGRCSAFMAPTEILANQHYRTLSELLSPLGMRVGLLTGSIPESKKSEIREELKRGEIDLIIGTHALISEAVQLKDLGLTVTDEQHRFGVDQRSLLSGKGSSPHMLVMSATPIPRTLALIIYGDLDVSDIDEIPPGRRAIQTYVVGEGHRRRIYDFVRKLVGQGRQAYIVCPMVEDADDGTKAAREYCETLRKDVFPELRIGLVHGKMPPKEKDSAMSSFAAGEIDVLVATTVVEVGVDVENAALMIVEDAGRFGLSQLHQLRGRVGRGRHESYCVLFRGATGGDSRERLEIMKATSDGYKIAEEDLRLRGPGEFFGSKQHGLPQLRIASFAVDMALLMRARCAADEALDSDPELTRPEHGKLAAQITRMVESTAAQQIVI